MRRVPQKPIEGYFPPAIDPEPWHRAQTLLQTSGAKKRPQGKTVQNILAGLAKCPDCGATMTRVWKGAGNGGAKLACTSAKTGGLCDYHSVPLGLIEEALVRSAARKPPSSDQTLDDEIEGR